MDFTRAIELNPKDDAPYYNRAQAKRLKKDAAGAFRLHPAVELGSTNPAACDNRGSARAEIMTGMAQLLGILPAQLNSNPITPALTTIALSRSRKREMRSVPRPTSDPGNSIQNWLTTGRPRIQKAILLLELRQSVFWMASSSSTCPLISLATLTKNPKTVTILRPWSVGNGVRGTGSRRQARRLSQDARNFQNTRKASDGYQEGFHLQWLKKGVGGNREWPEMG